MCACLCVFVRARVCVCVFVRVYVCVGVGVILCVCGRVASDMGYNVCEYCIARYEPVRLFIAVSTVAHPSLKNKFFCVILSSVKH